MHLKLSLLLLSVMLSLAMPKIQCAELELDPSHFVYISGGRYRSVNEYTSSNTKDEAEKVIEIGSFYVQKTPVTFLDFLEFCEATTLTATQLFYGWDDQSYPIQVTESGEFVMKENSIIDPMCPAYNVTWIGANAYCRWKSRHGIDYRLPTEAEWEFLASDGGKTKYPWGNEPTIGGDYPCKHKGEWLIYLPVGSRVDNTNGWGVLDLIGSVNQWVQDVYSDSKFMMTAENMESECEIRRVLKGGTNVPVAGNWWFGRQSKLPTAFSRWRYPQCRTSDEDHIVSWGFRCVISADQARNAGEQQQ